MFYVITLGLVSLLSKDRATQIFTTCLMIWLLTLDAVSPSLQAIGYDYFLINSLSFLVMCSFTLKLDKAPKRMLIATYLFGCIYSYACSYGYHYYSLLTLYPYALDGALFLTVNVVGFKIMGKRNNIWFVVATAILFFILPRTL